MNINELYPCIGICTPDPDSGYCLGCGRPPMDTPLIVATASSSAGQAENQSDTGESPAPAADN